MGLIAKEIWICIVISYIFFRIISFVVYRLSSYESYLKDENENTQRKKLSSYHRFYYWFVDFMHQRAPRSIAGKLLLSYQQFYFKSCLLLRIGRIVTGVGWLFICILFAWYIARVSTFPTVSRSLAPIETLEDLTKQTEIRYGVSYGGSTMAFFNNSKHKLIQDMWSSMQQHKEGAFVSSTKDGIELVRRSKGTSIGRISR
jgi:hypothetical protein